MKKYYILVILTAAIMMSGCMAAGRDYPQDSTTTGTQGNQGTEALSAPTVSEPTVPGLDSAIAKEMRSAYLASNAQCTCNSANVTIAYFGEYDGAQIAFISCPCFMYTDAIRVEEIGGLEFIYPDSQELLAYRDGELCSIMEAYEDRWFTEDGLTALHEKYKAERAYMYHE